MTVEVRGAWWGWRVPSCASAGCGGVFALASILALSFGRMPWAVEGSEKVFVGAELAAASLVVFALAVAWSLAKSVFVARAGRVSIDDDGVVFKRGWIRRKRVAWSELEGYSDASSARVDLVRKGERFARPALGIPTRDDASRTAVLTALDARGLHRIEIGTRGRRVVRAVLVGVIAVVAFNAAVWVGNRPYRRFNELLVAKKVETHLGEPSEWDTFVADHVSFRHLVRTKIGTEDALYIETRPRYPGVPAFFMPEERFSLSLDTRLEVDGRVIEPAKKIGYSCSYRLGGWEWVADLIEGEGFKHSIVLRAGDHGLAPGRHDARIVTRARIGLGECEKSTTMAIDVVPGSAIASAITLVHGETPKVQVQAMASGNGHYFFANHEWQSRALAARVRITDETGKTIATGSCLMPETRPGGRSITMDGNTYSIPLASGHHVYKALFTPDAELAFEHDAEIAEIQGDPFEVTFTVDVP